TVGLFAGLDLDLWGVHRSAVAAVKGQITETRESLRALIGAGASDMPEIKPVALPQVQTGIPATLSYELLARRPDLQAMRWYV
ncbi:hypothetical protein VXE43_22185, partial [Acinetobacter baumannii]